MKVHHSRAARNAEVGDIVMESTGDRYRITDIRRTPESTHSVLLAIEPKPPVRTWLWMLLSAIVSAAAAFWWIQ